jgi:hypothetical protein
MSIAFPRQQWLRERASVLGYTYSVCVVTSAGANRGTRCLAKHSICLLLVYLYVSLFRSKQCCFLQHTTDNRLTMWPPLYCDTEQSSDWNGLGSDNVLPAQALLRVIVAIRQFLLIRALVSLQSLLAVHEILRRGFFIRVIKIKYCTPGVHRYRNQSVRGTVFRMVTPNVFDASVWSFMLPFWCL